MMMDDLDVTLDPSEGYDDVHDYEGTTFVRRRGGSFSGVPSALDDADLIADLRAQLSESERRCHLAGELGSALVATNESLMEQVRSMSAKQQRTEALDRQLAQAQQKAAESNTRCLVLVSQLNAAEESNESLMAELRECEDRLQRMLSTDSQPKRDAELEGDRDRLEQQLHRMTVALEAAQHDADRATQRLEHVSTQLRVTERERDQLMVDAGDVEEANREVTALHKRIASLERSNQQLAAEKHVLAELQFPRGADGVLKWIMREPDLQEAIQAACGRTECVQSDDEGSCGRTDAGVDLLIQLAEPVVRHMDDAAQHLLSQSAGTASRASDKGDEPNDQVRDELLRSVTQSLSPTFMVLLLAIVLDRQRVEAEARLEEAIEATAALRVQVRHQADELAVATAAGMPSATESPIGVQVTSVSSLAEVSTLATAMSTLPEDSQDSSTQQPNSTSSDDANWHRAKSGGSLSDYRLIMAESAAALADLSGKSGRSRRSSRRGGSLRSSVGHRSGSSSPNGLSLRAPSPVAGTAFLRSDRNSLPDIGGDAVHQVKQLQNRLRIQERQADQQCDQLIKLAQAKERRIQDLQRQVDALEQLRMSQAEAHSLPNGDGGGDGGVPTASGTSIGVPGAVDELMLLSETLQYRGQQGADAGSPDALQGAHGLSTSPLAAASQIPSDEGMEPSPTSTGAGEMSIVEYHTEKQRLTELVGHLQMRNRQLEADLSNALLRFKREKQRLLANLPSPSVGFASPVTATSVGNDSSPLMRKKRVGAVSMTTSDQSAAWTGRSRSASHGRSMGGTDASTLVAELRQQCAHQASLVESLTFQRDSFKTVMVSSAAEYQALLKASDDRIRSMTREMDRLRALVRSYEETPVEDDLKQVLFFSLAIAIKLSLASTGHDSNRTVQELFDRMQERDPVPLPAWPALMQDWFSGP